MLVNLQIENIAIIEKASVDFFNGFNVLSGETGAGKSIIIDSINAVLGEKTSRELIRTGSTTATVRALFADVSPEIEVLLEQGGFPVEADHSLLLLRRMYKDGRNICQINGASATVSQLHRIGMHLINIHGQRDSQDLLNAEVHYCFVDRFAGLHDLLSLYREKFAQWTQYRNQLRKAMQDQADMDRKTDLLLYQIRELESADIHIGERDQLNAKKKMIRNMDRLYKALNGAFADLDTAVMSVDNASHNIADAAKVSPSVGVLDASLQEALAILSDCKEETASVISQLDDTQGDIEQIEERLDLLYRLSKKYGPDEEAMLKYLNDCRIEYESLQNSQQMIEELTVLCDQALVEMMKIGEDLTTERKKAAEQLKKRIEDELHFLDMPNAVFVVKTDTVEPNENGMDLIEFYISANPGEEPKPLTKVASGGELSRVMLAIKNALADKDIVQTLIFDEIDAGVSGRAADKIGQKLKQAAQTRQVICITHLSQIACRADAHYLIEKSVRDDKTFTEVSKLNFDGRVCELARMNGGVSLSQVHLEAAKQLLIEAGFCASE